MSNIRPLSNHAAHSIKLVVQDLFEEKHVKYIENKKNESYERQISYQLFLTFCMLIKNIHHIFKQIIFLHLNEYNVDLNEKSKIIEK